MGEEEDVQKDDRGLDVLIYIFASFLGEPLGETGSR